MFRFALRVLLIAAAFPVAAAPAAPEVVYDAAPKQILFDWNYVPRANWYEIWFQSGPGAVWAKMGERPSWYPHRDMNVSAHLLDWTGMRWDIRACNPGGCSAPGSLDIGSTVVNTVGYVKPTRPQSNASFGAAVDVSEDGQTLAVVASGERASASDSGPGTATVYVFRGHPNNWRQEARLQPSGAQIGNGAGVSVALNADGTLLALGVPTESFSINGGPSAPHGAVYLFRHDASGWHQEQRITYSDGMNEDAGSFVKLSDDGMTLAFSISGLRDSLEIYLYDGTTWVRQNEVYSEAHDQLDYGMSGDGQQYFIRTRLGNVVAIWGYDTEYHLTNDVETTIPAGYELSSFDVDTNSDTIASGIRPMAVSEASYDPARWKPTVTLFRLEGTNYQQAAVLAPILQPTQYATRSLFGDRIALSGHGTYVAVYDPHDAQGDNGVQHAVTLRGRQPPRGSIYLFEKHGTGWRERRHIGANGGTPDWIDGQGIFGALAFGNDGKTFVAAAPTEDGGIGGIHRSGDAEAHDKSAPASGAVWLY